MTRDRLALLVTSSALLVSWLSTPATPTPAPAAAQPAPSPARPPADPASALALDVARETDRLGQRLPDMPGPARRARDPFAFGASPRPSPSRPPARPAALPGPAPAAPAFEAPAATRPLLKLIGIAERRAGDAVERSAILSGTSDVYIVAGGDSVLGRFTVVAIGADAIDLIDTVTQAPVQLSLPR